LTRAPVRTSRTRKVRSATSSAARAYFLCGNRLAWLPLHLAVRFCPEAVPLLVPPGLLAPGGPLNDGAAVATAEVQPQALSDDGATSAFFRILLTASDCPLQRRSMSCSLVQRAGLEFRLYQRRKP
jgi:hypothetical protein